jgi:hypothetical protein
MAALEARLAPGTLVDVVDREGKVLRGDFVRADEKGVLITAHDGGEGNLVLPAHVATVMRHGDSLKNGMLIGAGIGVVSAILLATDEANDTGCYTTGCKVWTGVALVPVYAGIGALIDRSVKGREIVYRAPSERISWSVVPHPVRRGAGIRLALRF